MHIYQNKAMSGYDARRKCDRYQKCPMGGLPSCCPSVWSANGNKIKKQTKKTVLMPIGLKIAENGNQLFSPEMAIEKMI